MRPRPDPFSPEARGPSVQAMIASIPAPPSRFELDSVMAGTRHTLDSDDEDGPRDGHGLPLSWTGLPPPDHDGIRQVSIRVALPRRHHQGFFEGVIDRFRHPSRPSLPLSAGSAPPRVLMSMSKGHHGSRGHHGHNHRRKEPDSDDGQSDASDDHDDDRHHHHHHRHAHSHHHGGDRSHDKLRLDEPDPDLQRKFEELGASHTRSQVEQWYQRGARKAAKEAQERLAKEHDPSESGDEDDDADGASEQKSNKGKGKAKGNPNKAEDDSASDATSDGSDNGSDSDDEDDDPKGKHNRKKHDRH